MIKFLFAWLIKIKKVRSLFKRALREVKRYEEVALCEQISPSNRVLLGVFKGLYYPTYESAGSVLLPKIIGCYEDELTSVMNEVIQKEYDCVIDIGCAEGYYAVGLALKGRTKKVLAYDINPRARALCKKMSLANDVNKLVSVFESCSSSELISKSKYNKCLVVCDIEGEENTLFTKDVIASLVFSDVIIELHDYYSNGLSRNIVDMFKTTHVVELIDSKYAKPVSSYFTSEQILQFSISDIDLNERPVQMKWMFARAK